MDPGGLVRLTIGIAMGSWWSYYTLGWGGWWFWDPVENASFMPWLVGTALLHSAIVVEKREALKTWTILLAIVTFSLSLLGTFLVRSGVLTSVHAFASDPRRGVFILLLLGFYTGGALLLFAWRAPSLAGGGLFAPISREGGLLLNNLLLTTAAATVLIGTLYPLLLDVVTHQKVSVGPPFYRDDLRADHDPAADGDGGRADVAVEARRSVRRARPPQPRLRCDRRGGAGGSRRRRGALARRRLRPGARRLAVGRDGRLKWPSASVSSPSRRRLCCAGRFICRAPPGA